MLNTRAEAFAPATVANLGVGFDILGMAVEGAGDTIIAERRDEPGAVILDIEGDEGKLPRAAHKNVATIAANAYLQHIHAAYGVGLIIKKGLPSASGLGSSAASSVAAAVAVNALFGEPLSKDELLPACLEGEAAVSGYHADNVAPCLLGGITLTNGTTMDRIRRLPVPDNLYVALVTPDVEVPTSAARAVLPQQISLKQMVHQTGSVAALLDAIYRGDVVAVAKAMGEDQVVEPARAHLMPYLSEIRTAAQKAGALTLVISGAGPSLCAICDTLNTAQQVADVMHHTYANFGMKSIARFGSVMRSGAKILSVS